MGTPGDRSDNGNVAS